MCAIKRCKNVYQLQICLIFNPCANFLNNFFYVILSNLLKIKLRMQKKYITKHKTTTKLFTNQRPVEKLSSESLQVLNGAQSWSCLHRRRLSWWFDDWISLLREPPTSYLVIGLFTDPSFQEKMKK